VQRDHFQDVRRTAMRTLSFAWLGAGLLVLGCGSGDSRSPAPGAGGAAQPAAPAAAAPAQPAAQAPQAPTPPVSAPAESSAVRDCLAFSEQEAWGKALDPCTRAAQERPGDLAIRHGLQQAQAAAADASRAAAGAAAEKLAP
jgi:hypothetical protein